MADSVLPMRNVAPPRAIQAENLGKTYPNGTRALRNVTLGIGDDEFVVVIGSSGAGKSTFMRCLNRLVQPSEGWLALFGQDVTRISGRKLQRVRQRVGMIFQQFHLVRRLTALENVLVGRLRFNGDPIRGTMSLVRRFSREEKEKAFECLRRVGIAQLAFQRADTLSGGQQQRVAIARALAQEPEVFLADEPIASLDPRSAEIVMETLRLIHETSRIPVIVNLHHIDFAQRYGKRVLGMSGGRLCFDGTADQLDKEIISHIYGAGLDEEAGDPAACYNVA